VPRGSPGRRELQTDVSYQARLQVEDHARTTSIRPEGTNIRCRFQIPVRDPPEHQSVCSRSRCVWGFSPPFRSPVNALQGTLRTRVRNRKPPSPLWQAVSRARGTVRSPSERAHAPTTPRRRRAAALLIVVRRGNARSGRSFAFKAILSKRVDYRSPANGGIHAHGGVADEKDAQHRCRGALRRPLHPPGEAEHRTSARSSCIADRRKPAASAEATRRLPGVDGHAVRTQLQPHGSAAAIRRAAVRDRDAPLPSSPSGSRDERLDRECSARNGIANSGVHTSDRMSTLRSLTRTHRPRCRGPASPTASYAAPASTRRCPLAHAVGKRQELRHRAAARDAPGNVGGVARGGPATGPVKAAGRLISWVRRSRPGC